MPRQSRNSTGSATGDGHAGSLTTIAATTQTFPNAIFFPPCAAPSYAHRAWNTFRPHRLKNVPSTAAIATTVLRSARIIPQASATNSRCVDLRANTGASSSSRSRQVDGMGRLADLVEAAYDLFVGG